MSRSTPARPWEQSGPGALLGRGREVTGLPRCHAGQHHRQQASARAIRAAAAIRAC
jgi:hypothetical protein